MPRGGIVTVIADFSFTFGYFLLYLLYVKKKGERGLGKGGRVIEVLHLWVYVSLASEENWLIQ